MRKTARKTALFQTGFTLMELVMTLVILGIVSAMVAVFLQKPIQGYFDTTRRAVLVDAADFALRRIARDVATAVPNSVRSNGQFMELLQSRSGGRYNADTVTTTSLSVLGSAVEVANGDYVVIGNLPASGCNAYSSTNPNLNRGSLSFVASLASALTLSSGSFSPNCVEITRRFEVVSGPVTYGCETATATLWRYSGYAIQPSLITSIATLDALASVVKAALATNVNCAGTNLDASAVGEGLIELRIQLQDSTGESVMLYRQVDVDNTP